MIGNYRKNYFNFANSLKNVKDINTKSFLLLEFAGQNQELEIEDPFYLQQEEYNKILRRIEKGVVSTIKKIITINCS